MNKQLIAAGAAVVLAIAGIAALVTYANNADDRAFEGTEMVSVLRATADVPARTPVGKLADSIEAIEVPRAALVPGAVSTLDDVADSVTSVALVPGDQLSTAKFGTVESVKAETDVPKGMQELSIPVAGARLVGGAVVAGDRVGVFSSYDGVTSNPINDLQVLKVDNGVAGAEDATGTVITVAVGTLDAEKLVHTMEFGKIWLTKQNDDTDTGGGKTVSRTDVAP